MGRSLIRKVLAVELLILLTGAGILPNISGGVKDTDTCFGEQTNGSIPNNGVLDIQYIYNITKNLSDIIFTEYDEEHGEIAKGRFFGTKGEHKAAKILYENMTKLGLYTTMEQITNTPEHQTLIHEIEVLDYEIKVNDEVVDGYISPAWLGSLSNQNQLNYNFSYTDLKVKKKPQFPFLYNSKLAGEPKEFVFIDEDPWYNPKTKGIRIPVINPLGREFYPYLITKYTKIWRLFYPNCRGLILYDHNDDTHDMVLLKGKAGNVLPILFINGTTGRKIIENIGDVTINFYLNQSYNDSVISYNVIGQLNGTDPTKTVIVDCLYDSWWCQGTADSAIGMAMVLGIAKYFKENNIIPKYNMKFIGFGGEEYGFTAGSISYEYAHRDENIIYVIDLNQVGFKQEEPRLTLNIIANKLSFLNEIWEIAKKTDYVNKVGNTADIRPVWAPGGAPSDDSPFVKNRLFCKTVCFLKDTGWKLHHRDGLNHQEGDVLKYFDWDDVNATGEIVLNVTKYLTVGDL